jgi:hypothetical protein
MMQKFIIELQEFCDQYLLKPIADLEGQDYRFPEYMFIGDSTYEKCTKKDFLVIVLDRKVVVGAIGIHCVKATDEEVEDLVDTIRKRTQSGIDITYRTSIAKRHWIKVGEKYNSPQ